jgi:hypothetical protein
MQQDSSRIAAGKNRVSRAKRMVALTAGGGFIVVLGLARATHPGSAAASSSATKLSPPTALVAQAQLGSNLTGGSIESSSVSAPPVSTSTS